MAKFLVEVVATEEYIREYLVEAESATEAEATWWKTGDLTNSLFNDTLDEEVTNVTEIKGRNDA